MLELAYRLVVAGMLMLTLSGCAAEFLDVGALGAEDAAGLEIAGGRGLTATSGELSTLRRIGVEPESAFARSFLATRSFADAQMTSLVEIEERALTELTAGQRVYVAIEDASHTEAGWLRKEGRSTVYFNDGTQDLLRSERNGDTITHTSARNGSATPIARTKIARDGSRLEYSVWIPEKQAYASVAYGVVSKSARTIDLFTEFHERLGTLKYSLITRLKPANLPRPTIPGGVDLNPAETLALVAQFSADATIPQDGKCVNESARLTSDCRTRVRSTLVIEHPPLRYTVIPYGSADGPIPTKSTIDHRFSQIPEE